MEINYFGWPYSYSHIAAIKRFGKNHKYNSISTISKTIESALLNKDSRAVVPIENTTGGIIYDTVDTLTMEKYLNSDLAIYEELELNIRLFLLGQKSIKLSQVRKVYSHEFAIKRASDWIDIHLPKSVITERVVSTSEAVKRVKRSKFACAIGSPEAAKYYNLKNLGEIIVAGKRNLTRFFVLGKNGGTEKKL